MSAIPTPRLPWRAGLIWLGPALLVAGFLSTGILQSLPRAHAAELLAIAAVACGLAAIMRRVARMTWAHGLAFAFVLAWVVFVGPLPALATMLVVAAASGVGLLFTRGIAGPAVAAICGTALIVGILGWLLPFPLHHRSLYAALLLGIVALTRRRIIAAARDAWRDWRAAAAQDPAAAAATVLVVGLASVGCWVPTVQFDDLAYHLGLPAQLAALGYYRMDAHSQIWALAPWAGDIAQAVVQVVAGKEARGAVDAAWLLAIVTLSWQLAGALQVPLRARWSAAALAASQPLLAGLAGGMQAELPAAATGLALALVVARADEAGTRPALPFGLLAGLLLALKTGFVAIVLPLAGVLLWRCRARFSLRTGAISLLLLAAVAASSYVYAQMLTGNPLFPLLNATFRSPLLPPENLHDPRWSAPVAWDFPWRLAFFTREYGEGWNGLAGFSLLALVGAIPLALTLRRVRWLATCALLSGAAALAAVHYFRYAFPALLLLLPALVAAVFAYSSMRAATRLTAAVIALNLLYQGAAFWTLHSSAITRELGEFSAEPVLRRFAPERLLIAAARQRRPDATVLLCEYGAPFAAELAGRGFVISHYDPELESLGLSAEADDSGAQWRALFAHTNATFAIVSDTASRALFAALSDARMVQQIGKTQLWELAPSASAESDLAHERDAAARLRP